MGELIKKGNTKKTESENKRDAQTDETETVIKTQTERQQPNRALQIPFELYVC